MRGRRAPAPFPLYLIQEYVVPGGLRYLALAVKRQLTGGRRTTPVSTQINDAANRWVRQEIQHLDAQDLFDRIVMQKGRSSYLLKDDVVSYGDRADVEGVLHERLATALGLAPERPERVLEFGCAHGRNLFWLKSRYPQLSVYGVDISGEGIRLGQDLARRFELEVHLQTISTARLPFPDGYFDAAFTKHCLEQCPYTYREIIQELLRVTARRVVFFEPLAELYPWSFRGVCGRLHVLYHNYCRGVYRYVRRTADVTRAERLRWASNPTNESCVVIVEKALAGAPGAMAAAEAVARI